MKLLTLIFIVAFSNCYSKPEYEKNNLLDARSNSKGLFVNIFGFYANHPYQFSGSNKLLTYTELAGSGSQFSGDGTGASASFDSPISVIEEKKGSYLVVENNDILRRVTGEGNVTTIGNIRDFICDNCISSKSVSAMTFDSTGNFYIADGNKIRKILNTGTSIIIAGNDSSFSSTDGTGTSASFSSIYGIALDSTGNIYVTESTKIRKVTPSGVVTTLAGTASQSTTDGTGTSAGFYSNFGITIDSNDNLYVADGVRIRKVTTSGVVTTLAGSFSSGGESVDGTGTAARFISPSPGLVTDSQGNIYALDRYTIRKITPTGNVSTLAGSNLSSTISKDGTGIDASFLTLNGITIDRSGNLYVSESTKFRKVTQAGVVTTYASLTNASIGKIVLNTSGDIYFIPGNTTQYSVYIFKTDGNIISYITNNTTKDPGFSFSTYLNATMISNTSSSSTTQTINAFTSLYKDINKNIFATVTTSVSSPNLSSLGTLYKLDIANKKMSQYTSQPHIYHSSDSNGNYYYSETNNHNIMKVDSKESISIFAGSSNKGDSNGTSLTTATFSSPSLVVLNSKDDLFVYDSGNKKVKMISSGSISTITTSQNYDSMTKLLKGNSGAVYFANGLSQIVRIVNGVETSYVHNLTTGNTGNKIFCDIDSNEKIAGFANNKIYLFSIPE